MSAALAVKDGKGVMVDWRYEPGDKHLPTDAEVKAAAGAVTG